MDTSASFYWSSPAGLILVTIAREKLRRLVFTDDSGQNGVLPMEASAACRPVLDWLQAYFAGVDPGDRQLDFQLSGTPFQLRVWQAVLRVKRGETSTYARIAQEVGCRSPRAVGQAIARNPVALIVPCHRILMTSGKICGYMWGVPVKKWLLAHEGIAVA